jgi:hypothetical protein
MLNEYNPKIRTWDTKAFMAHIRNATKASNTTSVFLIENLGLTTSPGLPTDFPRTSHGLQDFPRRNSTFFDIRAISRRNSTLVSPSQSDDQHLVNQFDSSARRQSIPPPLTPRFDRERMADSESEDEALFVGVYPPAAATTAAPSDIALDTNVYKIALEIFSGKRFGCPSVSVMRSHLNSFVSQPATAFFQAGSVLATRFNHFKNNLQSSFTSVSAKKEVWTKPYLAPRLSLLLSLRHLREEEDKKKGASVAQGRKRKGKASAREMTTLAKAFAALYDMYQPCFKAYQSNEELELHKKVRMPTSLHLNENTARPHEHFQWDATKKLQFPCPVCVHVSTSLFRVDDVNADAMGAERVAAAAAISPTSNSGCFCFRINCNGRLDGSGCYLCEAKAKGNEPPVANTPGICKWNCPICVCHCACTFAEKDRQAIAIRLRKMKEKELKASTSKQPVPKQQACEQNDGGNSLMNILNNRINEAMDGSLGDSDCLEVEDDESNDADDFYGRKSNMKKRGKLDTALSKASLDMLNSREYYVCLHFP